MRPLVEGDIVAALASLMLSSVEKIIDERIKNRATALNVFLDGPFSRIFIVLLVGSAVNRYLFVKKEAMV